MSAFAVVYVNTLNIITQKDFHWKGRSRKIYTKMNRWDWRIIAHIGLPDYKN